MKKLLIVVLTILFMVAPISVEASEITPTVTPTVEPTIEPTPTVDPTPTPEVEYIYVTEFTPEEKQILLDSIQTIRATLVFFVFVIVCSVILKFFSQFF